MKLDIIKNYQYLKTDTTQVIYLFSATYKDSNYINYKARVPYNRFNFSRLFNIS
mgnify:CR=1 FL=1